MASTYSMTALMIARMLQGHYYTKKDLEFLG